MNLWACSPQPDPLLTAILVIASSAFVIDPDGKLTAPAEAVASRQERLAYSKQRPCDGRPRSPEFGTHIVRAYAAGSQSTHLQEMSDFFARVDNLVVNKGETIVRGIDLAVGACASFGAPRQVQSNVPVAPDCRGPEGCLFCDKFRAHADERDTRKC